MLTLWSAAAGCNNRMPMCIGSFSLHSKWIGLSKRYPNSSVLRRDVESDRLIGNPGYNSNRVRSLSRSHSYSCMGTILITPCYDVERLKPKTHVGLDPGESVEYTKHRVSLEGHPWLGCRPIRILGVNIVYGLTKQKRGLEQCWSSEPGRSLLSRKGPQGHPGCKTLQMWMARTSRPPHKYLTWTPRWTTPRKRRCLWWSGLWPRWGTVNVIASTNHLEILCFITGPHLVWLQKSRKSCSDFLYEAERSIQTFRALTGKSRDSWLDSLDRHQC